MLAAMRLARTRFAAVAFLVALVVGGTVEAAACAPEAAFAQASTSFYFHDDESQPDEQSEQHGLCSHGHCHHGSQAITDHAQLSAIELVVELPVSDPTKSIAPHSADTPIRPPRA